MSSEKIILSVTETAYLLGLSRNSTYQGVQSGAIPSIRVGKRILIPKAALERMLECDCQLNRRHDDVQA
jgi:excisionase family DNA binding protein